MLLDHRFGGMKQTCADTSALHGRMNAQGPHDAGTPFAASLEIDPHLGTRQPLHFRDEHHLGAVELLMVCTLDDLAMVREQSVPFQFCQIVSPARADHRFTGKGAGLTS